MSLLIWLSVILGVLFVFGVAVVWGVLWVVKDLFGDEGFA